ncbi:MAG: CDGSH iron-sulfur domain-containing protein [Chlorobiales bacterium]|nr:CDGSH iron-sulfur domain-containing protein [Chlorobiales bacterium]
MPNAITVTNDGPYKVEAGIEVRDPNGGLISKGDKPVFLCRCGLSDKKPFCDGTHKTVEFSSEVKASEG